MNFLNVMDVALLAVILLCAGDALRQLSAVNHPLRSIAFGLVTIGAFGCIAHDLENHPLHWWAVALHAGFAAYALILFTGRNPLGNRHGAAQPPRRSVRPAA